MLKYYQSFDGINKFWVPTSGGVEGNCEFIAKIPKRKSFGWALIPSFKFIIKHLITTESSNHLSHFALTRCRIYLKPTRGPMHMDGWEDFLHFSFLGEHILLETLPLNSFANFFWGTLLTVLLCLAERYLII